MSEGFITKNRFDPIMKKHENLIHSFAYITPEIKNVMKYSKTTTIKATNVARTYEKEIKVYGVMPSMFDATEEEYTVMSTQDQHPSNLSLGEQLYSARGSQGVGTGMYIASRCSASPSIMDSYLIIQTFLKGKTEEKLTNKYYKKRITFSTY